MAINSRFSFPPPRFVSSSASGNQPSRDSSQQPQGAGRNLNTDQQVMDLLGARHRASSAPTPPAVPVRAPVNESSRRVSQPAEDSTARPQRAGRHLDSVGVLAGLIPAINAANAAIRDAARALNTGSANLGSNFEIYEPVKLITLKDVKDNGGMPDTGDLRVSPGPSTDRLRGQPNPNVYIFTSPRVVVSDSELQAPSSGVQTGDQLALIPPELTNDLGGALRALNIAEIFGTTGVPSLFPTSFDNMVNKGELSRAHSILSGFASGGNAGLVQFRAELVKHGVSGINTQTPLSEIKGILETSRNHIMRMYVNFEDVARQGNKDLLEGRDIINLDAAAQPTPPRTTPTTPPTNTPSPQAVANQMNARLLGGTAAIRNELDTKGTITIDGVVFRQYGGDIEGVNKVVTEFHSEDGKLELTVPVGENGGWRVYAR